MGHQKVCAAHPKATELEVKPPFRLVAGTKCKGGLTFSKKTLPCEGNMSEAEAIGYEASHNWGYTLILVGLLVGGCCFMRLYYKYSASVGEGYAPVSQGANGGWGTSGQQSGVQVFGEIDPEMDDDYGEDELLAEGVLGDADTMDDDDD